jgi:hypothetical protein
LRSAHRRRHVLRSVEERRDDREQPVRAIVEFRAADHGPVASVVRRPRHRMVEELAAFAEPGR